MTTPLEKVREGRDGVSVDPTEVSLRPTLLHTPELSLQGSTGDLTCSPR